MASKAAEEVVSFNIRIALRRVISRAPADAGAPPPHMRPRYAPGCWDAAPVQLAGDAALTGDAG
jgi:hypothetical protein